MTRDTDIGGPGRRTLSRHAALGGPRGAERRPHRARARSRDPRRDVLAARVQVPADPLPRIQRGREGPDAGLLHPRAREGLLRRLRSRRRGSFRTYLRTCLDRFVANEKKAAGRAKRSPGTPLHPARLRRRGGRALAAGAAGSGVPGAVLPRRVGPEPLRASRSKSSARSACSGARTFRTGSSSATSSTATRTRSSPTSGSPRSSRSRRPRSPTSSPSRGASSGGSCSRSCARSPRPTTSSGKRRGASSGVSG